MTTYKVVLFDFTKNMIRKELNKFTCLEKAMHYLLEENFNKYEDNYYLNNYNSSYLNVIKQICKGEKKINDFFTCINTNNKNTYKTTLKGRYTFQNNDQKFSLIIIEEPEIFNEHDVIKTLIMKALVIELKKYACVKYINEVFIYHKHFYTTTLIDRYINIVYSDINSEYSSAVKKIINDMKEMKIKHNAIDIMYTIGNMTNYDIAKIVSDFIGWHIRE